MGGQPFSETLMKKFSDASASSQAPKYYRRQTITFWRKYDTTSFPYTEYDIIFRGIYTATEIWSILRLFSLNQGQD